MLDSDAVFPTHGYFLGCVTGLAAAFMIPTVTLLCLFFFCPCRGERAGGGAESFSPQCPGGSQPHSAV